MITQGSTSVGLIFCQLGEAPSGSPQDVPQSVNWTSVAFHDPPTAARRFLMPDPEHSLRKLQPDFVISPGTQVVVKTAKALPGGCAGKPAKKELP